METGGSRMESPDRLPHHILYEQTMNIIQKLFRGDDLRKSRLHDERVTSLVGRIFFFISLRQYLQG